MKVSDSVYTYDLSNRKKKKILHKIKYSKKIRKLFVVVLPINGPCSSDGLLEIYEYKQLLQPFYKKMSDDIFVVGLSKEKGGALEIVQNIIQDMYDSATNVEEYDLDVPRDIFDVKHFFRS